MIPASIYGHNYNTISIMLFMSGDKELPTLQQRRSLALLINHLSRRFHIYPTDKFSSKKGFHRDYDARKSCPGTMMTKSEVLHWLAAYKD